MSKDSGGNGEANECTLALIKPDASNRPDVGEIISAYSALPQIEIVRMKFFYMDRNFTQKFYAEHKEQLFFGELVEHMCSGACIAIYMHGPNAVEEVRKLNGATNPAMAEPGTLRARFGTPNGGPKNAVHSSADIFAAERELRLVFEELFINVK